MVYLEGLRGGKLRTMATQCNSSRNHSEAGNPAPIRHLLTREQTNRLYLQTHIRTPCSTIRSEFGGRENAQTIRVRLDLHHTARTDFLMFFSPVPPDTLSAISAAHPKIKRPWRDKDSTSARFRQNKKPRRAFTGALSGVRPP